MEPSEKKYIFYTRNNPDKADVPFIPCIDGEIFWVL